MTKIGALNLNPGIPCIEVITRACNPNTGEVRTFPTPCSVPDGWIHETQKDAYSDCVSKGKDKEVECPRGDFYFWDKKWLPQGITPAQYVPPAPGVKCKKREDEVLTEHPITDTNMSEETKTHDTKINDVVEMTDFKAQVEKHKTFILFALLLIILFVVVLK